MSRARMASRSLRARLVVQLLAVAAILAVALYFTVRRIADDATAATQDAILGAATTAVADALRAADGGVEIDLPYATFAMLGALGQERLFYRIDIDGAPITGYADLPLPATPPAGAEPAFYTRPFRDEPLRLAAVGRRVLVEARAVPVLVILGQTRAGLAAAAEATANRAALWGLGFFALAVPFSLLAATAALRPLRRLAEGVARRGPRDLRPVRDEAPAELAPLIAALNGFVGRLRGALAQTETFIAEAAHHIRTPLSTLRSEAELALRETDDPALRGRLRGMIRSAEESARSAGQLLDHAMVLYRADQAEVATIDLAALARRAADGHRPAAEVRDIALICEVPADPVSTRGDALMVEAALRNLIDNAVKYSDPDGSVTVRLRRAGGEADLSVRDRGRGLSGATAADLTRRFHRGRNVEDVVGSGLGLTIVAEAAAALGGRFTLEPLPEGGTCACLHLPLR